MHILVLLAEIQDSVSSNLTLMRMIMNDDYGQANIEDTKRFHSSTYDV